MVVFVMDTVENGQKSSEIARKNWEGRVKENPWKCLQYLLFCLILKKDSRKQEMAAREC